jgi:hypothetical protein
LCRRHGFSGDGDWCSEAKVHVHAVFGGAQPIRSAAVAAGRFGTIAAGTDDVGPEAKRPGGRAHEAVGFRERFTVMPPDSKL